MSQGLLPHRMPIPSIFLLLFGRVTLSCWLQIFLSGIMACVGFFTGSSYTISGGYLTPEGGLFKGASCCIPYIYSRASFHCLIQFFSESGAVIVAFFQKRLNEEEFFGVCCCVRHIAIFLSFLFCVWLSPSEIRQLRRDCHYMN